MLGSFKTCSKNLHVNLTEKLFKIDSVSDVKLTKDEIECIKDKISNLF